MTANAETHKTWTCDASLGRTQIEQLQQLLKSLPRSNKKCRAEIDEELDTTLQV